MKFIAPPLSVKIVASLLLACLWLCSCRKDELFPAQTEVVTTGAIADINSILFVNDSLGYMVGGEKYSSTELLTTTNGGKTWQRFYLPDGSGSAAYSLAYNGSKIIAAAYGGRFYTPSPNSAAWQLTQTSEWGVWFQQLVFISPNKGYLVSGEGYAGGDMYEVDSSLNIQRLDTLPYQLCDIKFANGQVGYTCGYGVVMKTTDAGITWNLQNIQGDFFKSISILDAQNVWMAGYNGSIIHTADGGAHWEKQRDGNDPLLAKYRFRAIKFKDINTGYAVGDKGLIVKTTDGGAHWSLFKQTTNNDLKCITIHPDGTLWIGGTDGLVLHITE